MTLAQVAIWICGAGVLSMGYLAFAVMAFDDTRIQPRGGRDLA